MLHEPLHEPRFARALLDLIPGRKRLAGASGSLVALRGSGMRTLRGEQLESSLLHSDQSNTSLVFGDQLVLKLFRRVEEGARVDMEGETALSS